MKYFSLLKRSERGEKYIHSLRRIAMFYSIETSEREDREGLDVWIKRSDGEFCSLICAENEDDPMNDGIPVPWNIIASARRVADKVGY